MEAHAETASKAVVSAETYLSQALDQKVTDYAELEIRLEKLRIICGNSIFVTFPAPLAKRVEDRLWDAHVKVNRKFQSHLKKFRDQQGKKKPVERRKAEQQYLNYIKTSQRFYRGYIQRLASNYDVPEIHDLAEHLHLETLAVQQPRVVDQTQKDMLLRSCQQSVLRLGDLSRYRETELQHKERNWGPAKGYYQLALTLDPDSGASYNQLAVIALSDDDHLRAVYCLHRAVTVRKPYPTAPDNIKVEFEKILKFRADETLGASDMSSDVVNVLQKRFLAFHANCFSHPYDFVSFQKNASDMLGLIALGFNETKDRTFDNALHKMCLVNMAAEHLAKRGTRENILFKQLSETKLTREMERNWQSFVQLQRFNMMTFVSLLKVLLRELEGDPAVRGQEAIQRNDYELISGAARRVLPHLRQYSSWLLSNVADLLEPKWKSSRIYMQQVWKTYVQALNLLLMNFDVLSPNSVDYLLTEDEDTSAFAAFSSTVIDWRFKAPDGKMRVKHALPDPSDETSANAEMLLRVTDFVTDAIRLIKKQDELGIPAVPISLVGQQFHYEELPEVLKPPAPLPAPKLWKSRAHTHAESLDGLPEERKPVHPAKENKNSTTTDSTPKSAVPDQSAMEDMVADLVKNQLHEKEAIDHRPQSRQFEQLEQPTIVQETPQGPGTVTPNAGSGGSNLTAMDLVRKMTRSSGSLFGPPQQQAPLPSIFNSPFAPTANEAAGLSPRLGHAQRYTPPGSAHDQRPSGVFQDQLARQRYDAEFGSSPQPAYQFASWSTHETDTPSQRPMSSNSNFTSGVNGHGWQSPSHARPTSYGIIGQPRTALQDYNASLFKKGQ